MKRVICCFVLSLGICSHAAKTVSDAEIIRQVQPSLVRVEYTLRFDKGDSPEVAGWGERCPSCGEIHGIGNASELVREERPLEVPGFVLSADQVITPDVTIHPRFIDKIRVRYQDQLMEARPAAFPLDQAAVILHLEKPLQGTHAIKFAKSSAHDFRTVSYSQQNGQWIISVDKMQQTPCLREDGLLFTAGPSAGLIIDPNGIITAVTMGQALPLDHSWQQSPLTWAALSADQMAQKLSEFEAKISKDIVRIKLNFRSPKNTENSYRRYSYDDDNSNATEVNTTGIVMDPNHILILFKMQPKQTSRLERILIYPNKGLPVEAAFAGTLSDYGAFVVTVESPLKAKPIAMAADPVVSFDQKMLLGAEVKIQGENKTVYVQQNRIAAFTLGWQRQLQPTLTLSVENRFLFDLEGRLIALPISHRDKILSEEDQWSSSYNSALTATCYLALVLQAKTSSYDATNIPLSEEQENRIAWLGVEMQPLNEELARINHVSDMTRDGEIGAIVSFVYDNSPASQAGLEMGDILLRLHIDKQSRPMEVKFDDDRGYMEMFPWERLSELPEEYYDRLPTPWSSVENSVIRSLSDFGFGTHFQIELFRNGGTVMKDMVVTESPSHYDSAKRFKSEALGITVRNMTYEVRRYFRLNPDDPGVIISKLEPGSKASVGGIKPYEIITHINDTPVNNANEFEKMIQSGSELKLSVKRMTKGRIVNLKIDSAASSKSDAIENTEPNEPATEPLHPSHE